MSQTYIDFQEIKAAFTFDDAIEFLKLRMAPAGNQLRGKCPACDTGGPRGLAITPNKGFYCFGAKKGGDQIAMVAHVMGIGMRDAAMLIQEELVPAVPARTTVQDSSPRRQRQEPRLEPESKGHIGLTPLDYLEHDHEAVEALGLTATDAAQLGAGFANRGVLRGLVAIPLRTEDGVLIGYFGASEGRFGKLNFPNVVPFKKRA